MKKEIDAMLPDSDESELDPTYVLFVFKVIQIHLFLLKTRKKNFFFWFSLNSEWPSFIAASLIVCSNSLPCFFF